MKREKKKIPEKSINVENHFSNWTYDDYVEQYLKDRSVRFIEPMSAHEIDIFNHEFSLVQIAELKFDGHRGIIFMGEKNRCFSRNVSKKTGWYNENTDCVPHIRDSVVPSLFGTVIDGEFDYGNTSMGVQSVMGSLPERAIAFQEENGYIPFKAFDILYYKGVNVQKMPLWKRKILLADAILEIHDSLGEESTWYFEFAEMFMTEKVEKGFHSLARKFSIGNEEIEWWIKQYIKVVKDYKKLYSEVIADEKEGLMIKDLTGIYEQKRSKSYLKVKSQSTWDCVVMGFTPPTKIYEGSEIEKWKYWEVDGELMEIHSGRSGAIKISDNQGVDVIPVTKPYFMGWCGAIEFGVWKPITWEDLWSMYGDNTEIVVEQQMDEGELKEEGKGFLELVHVGDCKGLSEEELENIRKNGDKLIGTVIEVRANGIIDEEKGSLRHPRFSKWRKDKNSEQCVWIDHIREVEK